MTKQNEKLLVQLNVQELQELITKSQTELLNKLINVIQLNPTENDEEKIYSRKETAKLLNVSVETLFHWNNKKILDAKKMGNRVYYLKNDVMNKLNSVA